MPRRQGLPHRDNYPCGFIPAGGLFSRKKYIKTRRYGAAGSCRLTVALNIAALVAASARLVVAGLAAWALAETQFKKLIQNNTRSVRIVKRFIEYMRELVLGAKGSVVSFSLRQVKRALGIESKAEEAALRAALEALVGLGLLQKASEKKPRYLLQRGTPAWSALERGCTDLLAALADRRPREGQPNARLGGSQPAGTAGTRPPPGPAGRTSPKEKTRPLK